MVFIYMSRISRYEAGIVKFILSKSLPNYNKYNSNKKECEVRQNTIKKIKCGNIVEFEKKIKLNKKFISILFLTIFNNGCKKNNISFCGYNTATSIVLLEMLLSNENNSFYLSNYFSRSIKLNIKSFVIAMKRNNKNNYSKHISQIYKNVVNIINVFNNFNECIEEKEYDVPENESDLIKWKYIKPEQTEIIEKMNKKKFISNYETSVISKDILLIETAFVLGWLFGYGDIETLKNIKNSAYYFSYLYRISIDFYNLKNEIQDPIKYEDNFIINFGIQESYEKYLYYKQKFIESAMLNKIYTETVIEIINKLNKYVENVIEETTPDMRSNWTINTNSQISSNNYSS